MVTMSEVAGIAGVSRATASYALRGDPRIAETTAARVREVAHSLHYTTNLSARSLRSGHSGVIGVAIFELDRPYPSEMSAAMSRAAERLGLQAIVQQTSNSVESEISILQKVTSQLCDGTIFSPSNVNDEEIQALSGGKPLVFLDDISPSPLFDTVNTPCEEGAEAAVTHLLSIGCRHIAILGSKYQTLLDDRESRNVSGRRLLGCLNAFEKAGYAVDPQDFIPLDRWDPQDARQSAHELVNSGRNFDGVFCMTDTIALGFIRGLADCEVRVPQDIAVIGFDGIAEGSYCIPTLSTIATDLDDLADKAMGVLTSRISGQRSSMISSAVEMNPSSVAPSSLDPMPISPVSLTARYSLVQRESTKR